MSKGHMEALQALKARKPIIWGKPKVIGGMTEPYPRGAAGVTRNVTAGAAVLYRHFDEDGRLLYVGITRDPAQRLQAHKQGAAWFDLIRRVEIEEFPDRAAAEKAEVAAIATEKPLFNVRPGVFPPGTGEKNKTCPTCCQPIARTAAERQRARRARLKASA